MQPQARKLTVFFKGDALERFEGDEMPSEAEFVATLDNKRKDAKVPVLEASEESLKQFSAGPRGRRPRPRRRPSRRSAASYPPLEPPGPLTVAASHGRSRQSMHKVAVAGASGRMGHMLIEAMRASDDCQLAGALDIASSPAIGNDAAAFLGHASGVPVIGRPARGPGATPRC